MVETKAGVGASQRIIMTIIEAILKVIPWIANALQNVDLMSSKCPSLNKSAIHCRLI